MFKTIQILIIGLIAALLLTACGPSNEDAQKQGFANVAEMKEIQGAGFKTKDEYEVAQSKKLGFENVSEMKEVQSQGFKDKESYLRSNSIFPVTDENDKWKIISIPKNGLILDCKAVGNRSATYKFIPLQIDGVCDSDNDYVKNKYYLSENSYKNVCKESKYGEAVIFYDANKKINPSLTFLYTQPYAEVVFDKSIMFLVRKSINEQFGKKESDQKMFTEILYGTPRLLFETHFRLDRESGDMRLVSAFINPKENEYSLISQSIADSLNLPVSYKCEKIGKDQSSSRSSIEALFIEIRRLSREGAQKRNSELSKNKF